MAITFNFSSDWPNIQVAKVVASPHTAGVAASYPYLRKIEHGLGYPPLCIGMGVATGKESYNTMTGVDVDETYIYIEDYADIGHPLLECVVIHPIDITQPFSYPYYASEIGTVVQETVSLDLRKFLISSTAVSPMVLAVANKNYTTSDLTLTYNSPLSYPTFSFGYVRLAVTGGVYVAGVWKSAPLQSQAFPWLETNGVQSILSSTVVGSDLVADKGSIITLRNPAIVTENTVSVSI